MSPEIWESCDNARLMLDALYETDTGSERKFRLFAVARCRSIWGLLSDERSRQAVEVAERYAEGQCDGAARATAETAAQVAYAEALDKWVHHLPVYAIEPDAWAGARNCASHRGATTWHRSALADMLREIFGKPFSSSWLDPSWLTPTVVSLAEAAYEDRQLPQGTLDPARLAVLHDALLDAGCNNEEMLQHLRRPEPHPRGCWLIDLLTSRQ